MRLDRHVGAAKSSDIMFATKITTLKLLYRITDVPFGRSRKFCE
jgi:hypothetical protein